MIGAAAPALEGTDERANPKPKEKTMTRHDEFAASKAAKRPWRAGMVLAMLAAILNKAAPAGDPLEG